MELRWCAAKNSQSFYVAGETFAHKDGLKELGGTWNWNCKRWEFSADMKNKVLERFPSNIAEKKILPHPDYKNGKALSRNNSFSQMNTPPSSQSEAPTLEECESRVREVKRQGNEAPKEYTHKPCNNDNGSPYNSQSKVKGEPESDEDSCDEKAALRASNGKVGTKAYSSKKACVPQTEIYVLELEGGRYYVGKSTDVKRRAIEHLVGEGSSWTQRYKPVGLVEVVPFELHKEDQLTLCYMQSKGIDNVRGGVYTKMELSKADRNEIEKKFSHEKNACFRCGRADHWAKDCTETKHANGSFLPVKRRTFPPSQSKSSQSVSSPPQVTTVVTTTTVTTTKTTNPTDPATCNLQ